MLGVVDHAGDHVAAEHEGRRRVGCLGLVLVPASEHMGEAAHIGLGIRRDWRTLRVELSRAVGVELEQADGEQLHHFARIVLVGLAAGLRVLFEVALGAEELAHFGGQGHVLQQLAEVAEHVATQQIPVPRGREVAPVVVLGLISCDDKHLGQRQGESLSHLVRRRDHLVPQHRVEVPAEQKVSGGIDGRVALGHHPVPRLVALRQVELRVEPRRISLGHDGSPTRVICGELRLQQKARGLCIRGRRRWRCGRGRR
mmetsp:Transcript_23380/g.55644  ORF Transcript_23380/g.55644 Transcript_23380/m.55644 type:complete len:256 (-) Transcript_23380:119-886(-)